MNFFEAILIAIVEGLTEFLPISSTAHMILLSSIFGIEKDEFTKLFQISIQFGAILSVIFLYYKDILESIKNRSIFNIFIAVIPALIIGKILDEPIEAVLEKPIPISIVLILGGIVLIYIDKFLKKSNIDNFENITSKKALKIGFWQCLAMMPGTSRAAATIIGAMQQGLNRELAAKFSFLLAIPTMGAVTLYSIFLKNWNVNNISLHGYELIFRDKNSILFFFVGNVIAFLVAIFAIKGFINFLKKYGFRIWGYYRIFVGVAFLIFYTFFKSF